VSEFSPHHVALSVRDCAASARFYEFFGYEVVLTWQAEDDSLTIVHLMRSDGQVVELFGYAANRAAAPLTPAPGNDLDRLGLKHFAFNVEDIEGAREAILAATLGEVTPIVHGRTRIAYFFVRDPDGNWVEIVQEDRGLDPQRPWQLRGDD
jgi:catechol 2,3-dioxygenase-like lactoylglutathione lyase family enzyme